MATKTVILCGGEGRRLRPLTNYFQKTMVPIGPRKRPLLEYVVRLLVHHKLRDITMLTGYRAEEIENYFDDGSRFGARINYSRDPGQTVGSGGALAYAISKGKLTYFDDILVYYGDILSNINPTEIVRAHRSAKAGATLVLSKGYTLPVGVATVENGSVTAFAEKPTYDIDVTTGNMVINKKTIPILMKLTRKAPQVDLMKNFIPALFEREIKVASYYLKDFWYDVGTVEKYLGLEDKAVEKHLGFLNH
ncbi:MAG: nucleotidyltransferase family protein [Nitrososphaerota archaeon]|jgi:mannose-1-phosphate guanylyltransferase|nr:nucleotidyltransferase family protein [Nitrososphaerota archaeon]